MNRFCILGLLASIVLLGGLAGSASAQYKAPKNRPFESYSRRPSVSPYMNLLNNQTGNATNYQSLVRPQLDQQSFNQKSASAIKGLQSQAGKQQSKSGSEGNQKLRPTGHAATRQNYSHFYPGMNSK